MLCILHTCTHPWVQSEDWAPGQSKDCLLIYALCTWLGIQSKDCTANQRIGDKGQIQGSCRTVIICTLCITYTCTHTWQMLPSKDKQTKCTPKAFPTIIGTNHKPFPCFTTDILKIVKHETYSEKATKWKKEKDKTTQKAKPYSR